MSLNDKFILPLINKDITLSDVSKEAGFVNIYTADKNRPYLDNHNFLLYTSSLSTKEACDRMNKFSKLDNFYNRYFIKIGGVSYVLYAFTISNPAIKKLVDNVRAFSDEDVMRIIKFWNFTDSDVNHYMIHPDDTSTFQKFSYTFVPEEDYTKELTMVQDTKSQAFHLESLA